jgi:hypothetical protein
MNRNTLHTRILPALLLTAGLVAPALAQNDAWPSLQPHDYNRIKVVSGGVTLDEAAAVKRMSRQYPLRVVLSGRGGDYYIAQTMTVTQGGRVLAEIPDAGPWLLIDLPPGRYTLQGRFEGLSMSRDVTVTGAGTTVNWVLPPSVN